MSFCPWAFLFILQKQVGAVNQWTGCILVWLLNGFIDWITENFFPIHSQMRCPLAITVQYAAGAFSFSLNRCHKAILVTLVWVQRTGLASSQTIHGKFLIRDEVTEMRAWHAWIIIIITRASAPFLFGSTQCLARWYKLISIVVAQIVIVDDCLANIVTGQEITDNCLAVWPYILACEAWPHIFYLQCIEIKNSGAVPCSIRLLDITGPYFRVFMPMTLI